MGNRKVTAVMAGWLLFIMIFSSLVGALMGKLSYSLLAGACIWIAAFLLFPQAKKIQKLQTLVLLGFAIVFFAVGYTHGANVKYVYTALEGNQVILSMLVSVSFLRIVALANVKDSEHLPKGKMALFKTLVSAHIFACVMNMSAPLLIGERMSSVKKLNPIQSFMLVRAFSACSCWSPFFATMGLTLMSAPGSKLLVLMLFGIPMGLIMLGLTAWQMWHHPDAEESYGYPMTISSLWLPIVMCIIVLVSHMIWHEVPVITLVTLLALVFTVVWLFIFRRQAWWRLLYAHIVDGLPKMAGEVLLFLSSAVLACSVAAAITSLNINIVPQHFGLFQACCTIVIFIILAIVGMHPVTTVALAGGILAPVVTDMNLLGLTMLFGWAFGVCFSSLSGIQLSIQARLGVPSRDIMKLNMVWGLPMLLLSFVVLYIYTLIY